jgi:hypothetical protein
MAGLQCGATTLGCTPPGCSAAPVPIATFRRAVSESVGSAGLKRSRAAAVSDLFSENPVRYELVAHGQRWLGACGIRAIYSRVASYLWRAYLLYGAIYLQLARYCALIGAMFAIAQLKGGG